MSERDASPPAILPQSRRAAEAERPSAIASIDETHAVDRPEVSSSSLGATDQTTEPSLRSSDERRLSEPKAPRAGKLADNERRNPRGLGRAQKPRSSSAFLLSDALFDDTTHRDRARAHRRRHDANSKDVHRRRHTPAGEGSQSSATVSSVAGSSAVLGWEKDAGDGSRNSSLDTWSGSTTRHESAVGDMSSGVSPRTSMAALDMDAAQIVSMALNLSESRRLGSRKSSSQPLPPRLAPLPDSTSGGSLRQHLQQQRRVSRAISPKPDRNASRVVSHVSPLQATFDAQEVPYRYTFSPSTLARAQKAIDHIELLAQYRRILDHVPPLEASRFDKLPEGSVQAFKFPTHDSGARVDRPYNPLQFIRNRKVRGRERKTIEGAELGFNHVIKVTAWADEIAGGTMGDQGKSTLPPFTPAEEHLSRTSRPNDGSSSSKPRRPRVDWFINPADLLADLWWLEQGDNKKYVEDRHWRRIFPQEAVRQKPSTYEDAGPERIASNSQSPNAKPSKPEHDHILSGARERAHQKLRALRGGHNHPHSGAAPGNARLRKYRSSISDTSDEDHGSMDNSTGKNILEKQMLEMLVQEQRTMECHQSPGTESRPFPPQAGPVTREKDRARDIFRRGPFGSRNVSRDRADFSETDGRRSRMKPLPASPMIDGGRGGVDAVFWNQGVGYDTSQPTSPELKAVSSAPLLPAIGMDLSPMSSRPGSPIRKGRGQAEDAPVLRVSSTDKLAVSSRKDESPARKVVMRGAEIGHRSQRSLGSIRHRGEDGVVGLRGLMRVPRIDGVLRSGVSKVNDFIWRRESSTETWADEMEGGEARTPEHSKDTRPAPGSCLDTSRPPSQPLSRVGLLKPPKLDVQAARASEGSAATSMSRRTSVSDSLRAGDGRPKGALSLPKSARQFSCEGGHFSHWPPSGMGTVIGHRVEAARLRTLILSSGIRAMEMERRARERKLLTSPKSGRRDTPDAAADGPEPFSWSSVARLCAEPATRRELVTRPMARTDMYRVTGHALGSAMQAAEQEWQASVERFAKDTAPRLHERAEALLAQLAGGPSEQARRLADDADDANRDLATGQRLRVKRVIDAMDKMLRRKRRRFRWVRRATWLAIEWFVVGCMWWLWFLFLLWRSVTGVGRGVVVGIRWLLWL